MAERALGGRDATRGLMSALGGDNVRIAENFLSDVPVMQRRGVVDNFIRQQQQMSEKAGMSLADNTRNWARAEGGADNLRGALRSAMDSTPQRTINQNTQTLGFNVRQSRAEAINRKRMHKSGHTRLSEINDDQFELYNREAVRRNDAIDRLGQEAARKEEVIRNTTSRIDEKGNVIPKSKFRRKDVNRLIDDKIKKSDINLEKVNKYAYDSALRDVNTMSKAYEAGDYGTVEKLASRVGIDPKDARNIPAVQEQMANNVVERAQNPRFSDYMGYHKVPQRGAAIIGTAYLVNNMSDRRGQMSNNELYGQAPPYGM